MCENLPCRNCSQSVLHQLFLFVGIVLKVSYINLISKLSHPSHHHHLFSLCFLSFIFQITQQKNPKTESVCASQAFKLSSIGIRSPCGATFFLINVVFVHFRSVAIMAWCEKHHRALFVIIHGKELPLTTRVLYQVFSPYEK